MNRKLPWMILLATSLFFLASCQSEKKGKVLKLAHGLDAAHPVHKAMVFMGEQLYQKSGGKYRIEVYCSGQLGTERECIELLQIGSLSMTKVSSSVLEGFVHRFSVYNLPFLFRDDDHRARVLEGSVGRQLLLDCEKYWVRGLCYFDAGSRSFYSKAKPINSPEDLKGLKIRTQESPTSLKMVQALGGSATPIAWGELYTALQQGIVDGAENNPPSFYLSHHYEVCKYYALDEHTSVPDVLLISTVVWNSLTPEARQWVQEAADTAAVYERELWKVATQEALDAVQKAGVIVSYPDKKLFQDKVKDIYESYKDQPETYELIQQIRAVQ